VRLEHITQELTHVSRAISSLRTALADRSREDSFDALLKKMAAVTKSNDDVTRQQAILQSLSFPSQSDRSASVSKAHGETYGWVFGGRAPASACPDPSLKLLRWLENGSGIFWVSGKAGSGKSTFVKFVANDPRTLRALRSGWAGSANMFVASYFFWAAGSAMQRSQQGLLQSLLFDIFRQDPTLIPTTCSHRWSSASPSWQPPWDVSELQGVLRQVAGVPASDADGPVSNETHISTKFCIFIDGLDEYEGDHLEFCDAIKKLSQSTRIKLCVSSRPWNVFEDAFGHDAGQKIYIHELTSKDVRSYAESRLQGHPRWDQIVPSPAAAEGQHLLDQITKRSSGVFLWVVLVTRLLREGLTNYDSLSDLQRRLEEFPAELEEVFRSIFESVEPFYHAKMATTFRIAIQATAPLPIIMYGFHDLEYEDRDYALKLRQGPMSMDAVDELEAQTVRRLNGRSRGLLEVDAAGCVNFLHKAVMDFLKTKDMADFLTNHSPGWFNEGLSILKAYTAVLKSRQWPLQAITRCSPTQYDSTTQYYDMMPEGPEYSETNLLGFVGDILLAAVPLDSYPGPPSSTTSTSMGKLLDEVEISLKSLAQRGSVSFSCATSQVFREIVIDADITNYVGEKLAADRHYLDCLDKPAIWTLMMKRVGKNVPFYRPREKMFYLASMALENGSCRDEVDREYGSRNDAQSPWVLVMDQVLSPRKIPEMNFILNSGIIPLLLKHGASPTAHWGEFHIWEKFLHLALSAVIGPSQQHSYLRTLDNFIATGKLPEAMEAKRRTRRFFQDLAAGSPWPYDKVQLLEGVLDRLLPVLYPIDQDEKFIWDPIRGGLPAVVADGLFSRHEASHHREKMDDGKESGLEDVSSDSDGSRAEDGPTAVAVGGPIWPLWNHLSSRVSSALQFVRRG